MAISVQAQLALQFSNPQQKASHHWRNLSKIDKAKHFPNRQAMFLLLKARHEQNYQLAVFPSAQDMKYILGFMNSKCVANLLYILNPSMNFGAGTVGSLPIIQDPSSRIDELVEDNIKIAKEDWGNAEENVDFTENPLVRIFKNKSNIRLGSVVEEYITIWQKNIEKLKSNEEELNRMFISIYGLQDELTPDVPLNEVTILQQKEINIDNGHNY